MKGLILFILGLLLGSGATIFWNNTLASANIDREFKLAEQEISEDLLKVKAAVGVGVSHEDFREQLKRVSLNAGKLRLFNKMRPTEAEALSKTLRLMNYTNRAWIVQDECKAKPQDNCLDRLVEILWLSGTSVWNSQYKQDNDDRMFISDANSTSVEFGKSYAAYLLKENKLGFDKDGVATLLTDAASAIQSYFSAKGTWIE